MKVTIEVEAAVLQHSLVRCQGEGLMLDDVVTAWLKRGLRQERTILPTIENHRAKVLKMPSRS